FHPRLLRQAFSGDADFLQRTLPVLMSCWTLCPFRAAPTGTLTRCRKISRIPLRLGLLLRQIFAPNVPSSTQLGIGRASCSAARSFPLQTAYCHFRASGLATVLKQLDRTFRERSCPGFASAWHLGRLGDHSHQPPHCAAWRQAIHEW